MTSSPGFTVHVDHNPYLPVGGRDVSAVVTVTADDDASPARVGADGNAEIIIVDCSGSMQMPGTKIAAARTATSAAVDVIRDGTRFAIIAGAGRAWPVYPKDEMALDTRSVKTVRVGMDAQEAPGSVRNDGF
jgi:Mg-chelatase subunit ChlD